MYKTLQLSPMIPSYNLGKTMDFFVKILGFSPQLNSETYKILVKENVSVHLLNAGTDIAQMEFYMEVDNVDEVWQAIKSKIIGLKVKAPFDQDYGMRELHIGIPETNALMFIGSQIK